MNDLEILLRGYLATGDAGDIEALDRYVHHDVVVHEPGGMTAKGLDHELETWRSARVAMLGLHHEIQQVVSGDSAIAARVVISGNLHGKFAGIEADGRSFWTDQAIFIHVRDGKADEIWTVVDTGSFMRQVGTAQE